MYNRIKSDSVKVVILSFLLVFLLTILDYKIGLNLSDEGVLWYGSAHTESGEIPLRDFRSYDPGRYFSADVV